jgi:hypothetical protein
MHVVWKVEQINASSVLAKKTFIGKTEAEMDGCLTRMELVQ